MIKCNVTVCGTIGRDASMRTTKEEKTLVKSFVKKIIEKKAVLFGHSGKICPTQRAETQFFADFFCG